MLSSQGRTIKNILRTSITYVSAESEALGPRHLLAILQTESAESENAVDLGSLTEEERSKRDQVQVALKQLGQLVEEK